VNEKYRLKFQIAEKNGDAGIDRFSQTAFPSLIDR